MKLSKMLAAILSGNHLYGACFCSDNTRNRSRKLHGCQDEVREDTAVLPEQEG